MKQKITKNERTTALRAKIHVRLLLALLVGLLTGTGTAWADGTTNVNLLTNGDCANNDPFFGWTWTNSQSHVAVINQDYQAVNGYWQSGSNAVYMTQTVDLAAKGFTGAQLDNGSLSLIASGDMAAYDGGVSKAVIEVECLDGNGGLVTEDGDIYLHHITEWTAIASDSWHTYVHNQTLPKGTRKIRYSVAMQDFKSNGSGFYGPKFDNAVIMLLTSEQNVTHSITKDDPTKGTLTVYNTSSLCGKTVSVGYASTQDYYMSACNMSYTDANGTHTQALEYDKTQTSGTMTFDMPFADVHISATFTPIPTVTIGSVTGTGITASADKVIPGSTVTLSVNPDAGYIGSVSYTPTGSSTSTELATDIWYPQKLTFTMPASNVTVNGSFAQIDASTDLTVNIPKTGTISASIPAVYKSLKIYDDGGASGDYSNNCDGTLVLTAPTNDVINLKGTLHSYPEDILNFYDGNTATNPTIFKTSSYDAPRKVDVITTGNIATLNFKSDGSNNKDGIDLGVTLYSESDKHSVTLSEQATNAGITALVPSAYPGTVITLSVKPAEGTISNVSYTPTNGTATTVSGIWYQQTLTFTMPASDVNVNGSFEAISSSSDLVINMPKTGELDLNIPAAYNSLKIYDDGGASANYSANCNGTLVLTAPTNDVINLKGTLTASTEDILNFYDGNTASNPTKFQTDYITTPRNVDVITTGNIAKLNFQSDGSSNWKGIELDVKNYATCGIVINEDPTNASITSSQKRARKGDIVTLNVTPTTGYIGSVSYTSDDGTVTTIASRIWCQQVLTFTMPAKDVTINGSFEAMTSTEDLIIKMPKTGKISVTIPAAYKSLKIYDDGGASGYYSDNCDGTLELTAPAGNFINLKGTVETQYSWDYLYFYDGISTENKTQFTSSSSGVSVDMDVRTTGNTAKLYFYSDGSQNYSGIDLEVISFVYHGIVIKDPTSASITSPQVKAKKGDIVTLNVTPTSGTIGSLSYKSEGGNTTTIASGIWYPQTLTFTMPASDVTVNGSFAQITDNTDLTINMPKTGELDLNIPATYKSLKIYDDGGASGKYSDNCDGTLELTAPAGNVINLKGTVNTESYDYLNFFDGITATNSTKFTSSNSDTPVDMNVTTTGNTAKLYFYSDLNTSYSGIALDVVLKPLPITATPDATMTIDDAPASGYWATLYTGVTRTIPEGVTAYYIQDGTANDAYAKLVKLKGTVLPAGNGYLLNCATASTPLSFVYTETAATDVVTGNLLKGGAVETTDNESGYLYYILGRTGTSPDYTYGFYWQSSAESGVTDGTKVVSAANKAYLKVPHTTGGAKSMALTFGDGTTGISNTAASAQENGAWYTLQGVRLTAEPTQSGLYIHNKKKVIIK
jgi:hypothetical protein